MAKDIEREAFRLEMIDDYNMREVDTLLGKSFVMGSTNQAFKAWQAAKVHEAEKLKGKAVVPVEPTPKMIDSTWDDQDEIETMSHNSRNEFIYKKMIRVAILEAAEAPNE